MKILPASNEPKDGFFQWKQCIETSNARVHLGSLKCFVKDAPRDGNNRKSYKEALTQDSLSFFSLNQIHSSKIVECPDQLKPDFTKLGEGDGLTTTQANQVLTIRTADCLPLFLVQENRISLLHVGYKGLLAGILDEFLKNLEPGDLYVKIGDHIHNCCFEVREDVLTLFEGFKWFEKDKDLLIRENRTFIKLEGIVERFFCSSLGSRLAIDTQSRCTCCNDDLFSHRASKTPFRIGHVIWKEG